MIERMRKTVEKTPKPTEDEIKRMIVEAEDAYQTEHELYGKLKDMWQDLQDQKVNKTTTVVEEEPDNESEDMKQRRVS